MARELEAAGYDVYGTVFGTEVRGDRESSLDLCDRDAVREFVVKVSPNVVVHLAAISFVAHADVAEIYRTNILGTRNLLEAMTLCDKKPDAILLASSANIYGQTTADPIVETTPFNPLNDYAVSKLAMEQMARLWMDKLPITIVRPFNYSGVGQSLNFLLPKIVDYYRRGEKDIELGNLDVARDFSDVRMVARAYAKLLHLAPAGEVFNVCSGKAYTLQQILAFMGEIAGYEIKVKVNPAFVRENEVKSLRGSNANLIEAIGSLEAIPLQETLRWMYEEL
jgi:nucleoside-diphosphate-sugar epimerase